MYKNGIFENVNCKVICIINNDYENEVLIINSPKMLGQSTQAEKQFLGYEFSTNRNKLGISYLNDHLQTKYSKVVNQWISNEKMDQKLINDLEPFVKIKKLKTIVVSNESKMIYPNRYIDEYNNNWQSLEQLGFKINQKVELKSKQHLSYLEIGDLVNSQVQIKNAKNKRSKIVCKPGDLLFSSLTPNQDKVAIANDYYYVSNAIFVISHQDPVMIEKLFTYLMNDEVIFKAINGLLDGFKITYAKITKTNLINQVV